MSRPTARALLLTLSLAAFSRLSAQDPTTAAPTPPVTPATSDTPGAPTAPALTLEECIARVLEKNFSLKIQGFNTANAKESLVIAKADFEPTFTATGSRGYTQGINSFNSTINTNTGTNYQQDTSDVRLGVTQTITTGAALNFSTSVLRNSDNLPLNSLNPAYNSDVSFSIIQPLLRGAGTKVNRAGIETSKLGITIANLNYKGSVLQAVRDTEAAYYNLVFARGQLAVKQRSLALAEKLYDENKVRKDTGVATSLDVLTAEVGVAAGRNGVVLAQQAVRNAEDALLALTGQFEFDQTPGAVRFTPYTDPAPSVGESFRLARDLQPNYVATLNTIKQLEIAVDTAKNGSLPTLNLGGAVGFNGLDHTTGSSYDNLRGGDNYNWQVDLSLSVPWGAHADKARARTAVNNLHQEQTRLQLIEQALLVQVRAAVLAVETSIESVQISNQATQLAEKQYELQRAKFDAGLATSREVLQSQTDLETIRVANLQAKVNLRIAVANLSQLDGSSIERYHIALAE